VPLGFVAVREFGVAVQVAELVIDAASRYTPARFLSSDPGWCATMRTDHAARLAAF
jgi:hypothetical protein